MTVLKETVYLSYKGPVLYDTIGDLIGELKEIMFEHKVKLTTYKKVLMVMIETLENIFKYHDNFSNNKEISDLYPPTLQIKQVENLFLIECTNPIKNKDIDILKNKIDEINKLDKAGIKEKYKQTITNGEFSEKGGAGLGIIEMAKITDGKLQYRFDPINSEFSEFQINLNVKVIE